MKLTPWFPGHVKPVRKGVYEVCAIDGSAIPYCYALWDRGWMVPASTPDEAKRDPMGEASVQCRPWRGLAEQPKEKQ